MRHNKYGAVQTIGDDGQPYDSRLEAEVARVLDLLQKQGRIERYERQVPIELAPARGRERSVVYVADFAVQAPHASALVEAKGYMPAVSRLKLRWLREKCPDIRLFVVRAPEEVIAVLEEIERADADIVGAKSGQSRGTLRTRTRSNTRVRDRDAAHG